MDGTKLSWMGTDYRRVAKTHLSVFLVFALGVTALGFYGRFLVVQNEWDAFLVIAAIITLVPFSAALVAAPGTLLHPLNAIGLLLLLGTVGQILFARHLASRTELEVLLAGLPTEAILGGLILLGVATASVIAGFGLVRGRLTPRHPVLSWAASRNFGSVSLNRMSLACVAILLISAFVFTVYGARVGISGSLDLDVLSTKRILPTEGGGFTALGYHRWAMGLAGYGFVLVTYAVASRRSRWWSLLGLLGFACAALTIVAGIVTSSRLDTLAYFAISAVLWTVLRREPSVSIIGAALLVALTAFSLMAGARALGQGQLSSPSEILDAKYLAGRAVGDKFWMSAAVNAAVVERVPDEYPYLFGRSFVGWVAAPIPRDVWPDKPRIVVGEAIGQPIFHFPKGHPGGPPGLPGELYINGGWPMLIAGMVLFGVFLRRLERWRDGASRHGLFALAYSFVFVRVAVFLPMHELSLVIIPLLRDFFTLSLLLLVVRSGRTYARLRTTPSGVVIQSVSSDVL